MALIQGIDAGALINAFRQGKADRFSDEEQRLKVAGMRADAARKAEVQGILGQIGRGPGNGGGIAGAYDPKRDGIGGGIAASQPPTPSFDQAFSPNALGAIANGETPSVAIPQTQASQPAPQAPPRAEFDPNLMQRLMVLDPETGSKIATGLKQMSETQIAQRQALNMASGTAAHYLLTNGKTPQERQALLQHVIPILQANGVPPEGIQRLASNLSDQALNAYTGMAMDMDKILDNERADREQRIGKDVAVVPGGSVAHIAPIIDAQGNVTGTTQNYIVGGGGAPSPALADNIPHVQSPQEAAKLPPGSHFYDPNGVLRTVPGGASGNAGGGFPGAQ